MKIYTLSTLPPAEYRQLLKRPSVFDEKTMMDVGDICRSVRRDGAQALRAWTGTFDGADLERVALSEAEIESARATLLPETMEAIAVAAENIRAFHAAQLREEPRVQTMPGVLCWREPRAIDTVGLYIPAGSAPLPSTVLMLGIPALLAGCGRIILCTPPRPDGSVDPTVLAAAAGIGITSIFKAGGAQAIAAMAYGAGEIPKVEKIFGPGNRYVAAAKQYVAADPDGAAIDLLAGPSELLIIADGTARAETVAADLLSQAEHDPDARVVLVTTSPELAAAVATLLPRLTDDLPRRRIIRAALGESFILVTGTLREAVTFSNAYAPEHLIVDVARPELLLPAITSAGSVFLGADTPVTCGDYASGTNHTLPTGGAARWQSGVAVESFRKWISVQSVSREGLATLAPTLIRLAEIEGLEAHRRAVTMRLERS